MTTTLKIQKKLLKTAEAVEQMQMTIDDTLQQMLDTNAFYRLFEIDGQVHPYYKLQKIADDTRTAVYRIFKSVLDWQVKGKTIRRQLDETRAKDIVENGIGEDTLIDELRTLPGRANPAKVAAQQLVAAYELAAHLETRSRPQIVRVDLIKAQVRAGKVSGTQAYERELHKRCDAVRKELIRLSKVIRQVDRNGKTIEQVLQAQQTLMLLKSGHSDVIGVLLK